MTMEQIVRVATQNLSGKDFRVVFASEDNRESLHLRHWIVTVQKYPADYKTLDDTTMILFGSPPCPGGKAGNACSTREILDGPLFLGRFDVYGRFEGNIVSTASKMTGFHNELMNHQQWTQARLLML